MLQFYPCTVQRKNMVDALVEQISVVGNKQKSFFFFFLASYGVTPLLVEVVGWLVNQQEAVFAKK